MKRRFKPRKSKQSQTKKEEKILTIGVFDTEKIYLKNTWIMWSEDLKAVYKSCGAMYNPDIKGWVTHLNRENEVIKKVKELFKNEKVRILKLPKFVKKCIEAVPLMEKEILTFKSKFLKIF